nr:immunoglobulin light chain junction region [Macaca mulatta]MOW14301.1 immunoglobulin light chain junction region [Macaca mulatta]
CQQYADFPLTF